MRRPDVSRFRAFYDEVRRNGNGRPLEVGAAFRSAVLGDEDFLDALVRKDAVAAANALGCAIRRVYKDGLPGNVRVVAENLGVNVEGL